MQRSRQLALINIIFALFIILWGAYVRLSGSGAGCGEHWPLCNGEVIPVTESVKTLIEFIHRLTSGLFGFTMIALTWFSFRESRPGHLLRKYALLALFFTFTEALIGAVLVKKGLVAQNDSMLRAIVIAFHLLNTLSLMHSLFSCYFFAGLRDYEKVKEGSTKKWTFVALVFLMTSTFASGGIAALGNTLFPAESLIEGVLKDFSPASHFLIRLRIYHPLCAVLTSLFVIVVNLRERNNESLKNICDFNYSVIIIAVAFGVINWLLMAPVWGALVHLFIANLVWGGISFLSNGTSFRQK